MDQTKKIGIIGSRSNSFGYLPAMMMLSEIFQMDTPQQDLIPLSENLRNILYGKAVVCKDCGKSFYPESVNKAIRCTPCYKYKFCGGPKPEDPKPVETEGEAIIIQQEC